MSDPKIALIIPYFGNLPNYFRLWLKSCELNPSIDWFLITDNRFDYELPRNIKHTQTTFAEFKSRIQSEFDFTISLDRPYKLCDYKPVYGQLFETELEGYDFWGHCDMDLIWGNIRKFLTSELLQSFDRYFVHGHLAIYRNTPEVNRWYKTLAPVGDLNYKRIFTDDQSYCFDEFGGITSWGGINKMIKDAGKKQFFERFFDDVQPQYFHFYSLKIPEEVTKLPQKEQLKIPTIYEFKNGNLNKIFLHDGKLVQTPSMYAHFQKRKFEVLVSDFDQNSFLIIPNKFIDPVTIDESLLKTARYKRFYTYFITQGVKKRIRKLKSKL